MSLLRTVGDIHSVRKTYLGENKDKILLVLYTSKTHGVESPPQEIKFSASHEYKQEPNCFFCPFEAVVEYIAVRGKYANDSDPFFLLPDGVTPLKPHHFRTTLRELIRRLGLNHTLYDTHSMRGGHCSDLYKCRVSINRIRRLGRWKSNAVYKYLKCV